MQIGQPGGATMAALNLAEMASESDVYQLNDAFVASGARAPQQEASSIAVSEVLQLDKVAATVLRLAPQLQDSLTDLSSEVQSGQVLFESKAHLIRPISPNFSLANSAVRDLTVFSSLFGKRTCAGDGS